MTPKAHIPSDPGDRRHLPERRVSVSQRVGGVERRRNAMDRRSVDLRAVARSFGLRPEHLDAVSFHEAMESVTHCPSCESLSKKCVDLEARLAESQKEVAYYRSLSGKSRRKRRGS